ncbi:hypothetical protein KBD59_03000 [Candidatus Gracilibacteria bacterium]|nr:hypothetical protein [Candidatus Gracilibacteria bacterium]
MKSKIKNWIKRYLPAEIFGTLGAIIFPTVVSFFTKNILIIALAGTWGENMGFYGTMIFQEVNESRKKHRQLNKNYGIVSFGKSIRNIFLEFGLAETADSLFVRPATMFFTVSSIDNLQLGVFTGKIIADVIFYIPTVISYELRKKHLID